MKATESKMQIVLAADDAYVVHTGVVILSLLSNTSVPEGHRFFILSPDMSNENHEGLTKLCAAFKSTVEFPTVDHSRFYGLPNLQHFSLNTYARLLAPESCGPTQRLLYLDSDLVVLGDASLLFHSPLNGHVLGAVEQASSNYGPMFQRKHGFDRRGKYFNSGVLLFDVNKWQEQRSAENIFRWMHTNRDRLYYPDQDGLNAVFWNKYQQIDPSWNIEARLFRERRFGIRHEPRVLTAIDNAKLVHYTGSKKPWHRSGYISKRTWYTQYANQLRDAFGWNVGVQIDCNDWLAKTRFELKRMRFQAGRVRRNLFSRAAS